MVSLAYYNPSSVNCLRLKKVNETYSLRVRGAVSSRTAQSVRTLRLRNIHMIDFTTTVSCGITWNGVDTWHFMRRRSKLRHKPNKHIPPHHFTRENKKEYKVWINNNK